jgi:hypothetical protein
LSCNPIKTSNGIYVKSIKYYTAPAYIEGWTFNRVLNEAVTPEWKQTFTNTCIKRLPSKDKDNAINIQFLGTLSKVPGQSSQLPNKANNQSLKNTNESSVIPSSTEGFFINCSYESTATTREFIPSGLPDAKIAKALDDVINGQFCDALTLFNYEKSGNKLLQVLSPNNCNRLFKAIGAEALSRKIIVVFVNPLDPNPKPPYPIESRERMVFDNANGVLYIPQKPEVFLPSEVQRIIAEMQRSQWKPTKPTPPVRSSQEPPQNTPPTDDLKLPQGIKVVFSPSQNFTPMPNGTPVARIVNHVTIGSCPGALSTLTQPGKGYGGGSVSANFLICQDGTIHVLVDPRKGAAWHAVSANTSSIGIEHEGGAKDRLTKEQTAATVFLQTLIMNEYNLQLMHIIGHGIVISTSCPNALFVPPEVVDTQGLSTEQKQQYMTKWKEKNLPSGPNPNGPKLSDLLDRKLPGVNYASLTSEEYAQFMSQLQVMKPIKNTSIYSRTHYFVDQNLSFMAYDVVSRGIISTKPSIGLQSLIFNN